MIDHEKYSSSHELSDVSMNYPGQVAVTSGLVLARNTDKPYVTTVNY